MYVSNDTYPRFVNINSYVIFLSMTGSPCSTCSGPHALREEFVREYFEDHFWRKRHTCSESRYASLGYPASSPITRHWP